MQTIEIADYAAKLLKDPLTSIRFQDSLSIFLKWMQLQSGMGDFGQVCLLVAVPGMPEGSYSNQSISGLTNGTDSTVAGSIYFAPTRCMKGKKSTIQRDDITDDINAAAEQDV